LRVSNPKPIGTLRDIRRYWAVIDRPYSETGTGKSVNPGSSTLQQRIITMVGSDGAFQFPPLPRGTYTIEAEPSTEPLPTSLTVNLRRDETGIEIPTRRVRKIPGRVVVDGAALMAERIGFALDCPALEGMSEIWGRDMGTASEFAR
jgi:hypothetical protein